MPKKLGSVIKVTGNFLLNVSDLSTPFAVSISPNSFGSRLYAISDSYTEFRFTRLKFRFFTGASGGSNIVAGFVQNSLNVSPTTIYEAAELERSAMSFIGQTTPTDLIIGKKELLSQQVNWYRTRTSGSVDGLFESQGGVYFVSDAVSTYTVNIWGSYECELRGAAEPGLTRFYTGGERKAQRREGGSGTVSSTDLPVLSTFSPNAPRPPVESQVGTNSASRLGAEEVSSGVSPADYQRWLREQALKKGKPA
jgi:hypothetical protein